MRIADPVTERDGSGSAQALTLENIGKDFQGVHALKSVTLAVPASQRVALIGPNGAGKSTLLNIIHGQVAPSHGRIELYGRDVTPLPVHQRAHLGVARSFQVSSVFPELSVYRNVWLACAGAAPWRWDAIRPSDRYTEADAAVREALAGWDLLHHMNDLARELSYGEQRKLETLMALASKPRVLLLDEPSAGLTVSESRGIADRLQSLDRATTVILVAHDMDLVFGVAERLIVLHNGEVIADGPTGDVAADPRVRDVYMGKA